MRAALAGNDVRGLVRQYLVAGPAPGQRRRDIAHGARRHEHRGLLAEQISDALAQQVDGRVVAELLVADLGAPIGGAIAGSREFIDNVWRWKQRLGGSMRQAGVCAAACIYALDHNVDRLADDHANARALARGLSQINGIEVQQPETNLVFFKPDGAGVSGEKMVAALRPRGVLLAMMDGRIRACTHLDVTAEMIEEMVGLVREVVRGA